MAPLTYTQGLDPGDTLALLHYAAEVGVPVVGIDRVDPDPYVDGPVITVTIGESGVIAEGSYDVDGVRPLLIFAEHIGASEVLITPMGGADYWPRVFGTVGNLAVSAQPARLDHTLIRDLYEANQPVPGVEDPDALSVTVPLAELAAALDAVDRASSS